MKILPRNNYEEWYFHFTKEMECFWWVKVYNEFMIKGLFERKLSPNQASIIYTCQYDRVK